MFDGEANLMTSMKNSFNQSLAGSVINNRYGEQSQQSAFQYQGQNYVGGNGPHILNSPSMLERKQAHDENIPKPTCSSQS